MRLPSLSVPARLRRSHAVSGTYGDRPSMAAGRPVGMGGTVASPARAGDASAGTRTRARTGRRRFVVVEVGDGCRVVVGYMRMGLQLRAGSARWGTGLVWREGWCRQVPHVRPDAGEPGVALGRGSDDRPKYSFCDCFVSRERGMSS